MFIVSGWLIPQRAALIDTEKFRAVKQMFVSGLGTIGGDGATRLVCVGASADQLTPPVNLRFSSFAFGSVSISLNFDALLVITMSRIGWCSLCCD